MNKMLYSLKTIKLNQNKYLVFIASVTSIIIVITLFTMQFSNLTYPFLWFDEAITFWISKGIKVDAMPLTLEGGINQVIYYNQNFNLDPGGFTLLLYFWSKLGTSHFYLRLLPYFLFILSYIVSYNNFKSLIESRYIALILSIFYLLIFNYYSTGFELRGYSMELLLCNLCIHFVIRIRKKFSLKHYLLYSILICLLMTARYSSVIIAFTTFIVAIFSLFKNNHEKKIQKLIVITAPFLITSIIIYFFSYKYQKNFSNELPYLNYLNSNIYFLFKDFNLIFILLIILSIWLIKIKFIQLEILLLSILINIIFIVLSFFGKYPWDPLSSRCNVITLPIFTIYISVIGRMINENLVIRKQIHLIAFVLLIFLSYKSFYFLPRYDKQASVYNYLKKLDFSKKPKILIDRWTNPSLRYLYEYGNLKKFKNKHGYPERFKLMSSNKHLNNLKKTIHWYSNESKIINIDNFDVIIGPELYHYSDIQLFTNWKSIDNDKTYFIKK